MRILVLGVTGMLGHQVFRTLKEKQHLDVWGTLRDKQSLQYFPADNHEYLISHVDVLHEEALMNVFESIQPDVVINCVGVIKQLAAAEDPLIVLPINALLPHRLAKLCIPYKARLIHISTDCVFSGNKGLYLESDESDARDLYGKSKFIGELHQHPHALTLRTSIIGHELSSQDGLIDWFLSQNQPIKGFVKAVFSGLPTVELARIIRDFVIPQADLHGLYHVAAKPVNKYELLKLTAEIYGKAIEIQPDDKLVVDRSLNASRFNAKTGYQSPEWPQLLEQMHQSYRNLRGEKYVS